MPRTRHIDPRQGDVLVLVGTTKGAFLLRSDPRRADWELGGPYFPGQPVYAFSCDDRGANPTLWAGPESPFYGASLRRSEDFGRSWSEPKSPLRFPKSARAALKRIWQIRPGRPEEPDRLYCGVEPAALFVSSDGGASWELVRGLWEHPHRKRWTPGAGGLCLHTILPHPVSREKLLVAVSAAGVYRSDDGGRSWRTSHKGVRAQFLPNPHPPFGQCVHKVVRDAVRPERLFLQNHWGLYASDDDARSWKDVARGVPSDFGFAMAAHPRSTGTAYIVPLESDEFRCTPDGRLRVYRTSNAGRTWRPLCDGLPQRDTLETVLRDGLATDRAQPAGVYFGTRSGRLYASSDEGDSWRLLHEGLPPIVSVKTTVVGV
jgi:hypothetical protein